MQNEALKWNIPCVKKIVVDTSTIDQLKQQVYKMKYIEGVVFR